MWWHALFLLVSTDFFWGVVGQEGMGGRGDTHSGGWELKGVGKEVSRW